MKKIAYILSALLLLLLVSCGSAEKYETPQNAEPIYYEGHGIKMEIPAIWADSFVSYYKEFGEGETGFALLEFMTIMGEDEAGVLTIAVFNEQSWKKTIETQPNAESMKIGTSADGKKHYTIRYENTKFPKREQQKKFDQIVDAAKECGKKIEITE